LNNFRQKSEKKAIEARELRQKNNVPNMAVSHYVPALKRRFIQTSISSFWKY